MKVINLRDLILESPLYEEDVVKSFLERIVNERQEERERREERERAERRKERAFELEKLKLAPESLSRRYRTVPTNDIWTYQRSHEISANLMRPVVNFKSQVMKSNPVPVVKENVNINLQIQGPSGDETKDQNYIDGIDVGRKERCEDGDNTDEDERIRDEDEGIKDHFLFPF